MEGLDCVNCHPYTKQQLLAMVKGFVDNAGGLEGTVLVCFPGPC